MAEQERKTWVSLSVLNSKFSVMLPEFKTIQNRLYNNAYHLAELEWKALMNHYTEPV